PRVTVVQQALADARISVWRDQREILAGDAFIAKIEDGLKRSRCVVVFCSGSAIASAWVQREWNVALTLFKRIIPVRLDDSELPLMLRVLDFIELQDMSNVDTAVQKIAAAVQGSAARVTVVNSPAMATNPSVLGRDVVVLDRMISRADRTAASLATARWAAIGIGIVLS